ncbi:MAG: DNA alkylation repair protein [Saprospiraceae bacterium]|nr:DNA alkylation repair protein [Saprospiraceae bacterium]
MLNRKSEIRPIVSALLHTYEVDGLEPFCIAFLEKLLQQKVTFPLLEFAAEATYQQLAEIEHLPFCNNIAAHHTMGGNVVVAIVLKERLSGHFEESFAEAAKFIAQGQKWYVSDIIGERVFGNGILQFPEEALEKLKQFREHESKWVVRSIGAGCHLATKRGINKEVATKVFQLLLSLGDSKEHQIRKGIGWAAKTMARLHPDIIELYHREIEAESVGNWFRRKVNIGLERHRHA